MKATPKHSYSQLPLPIEGTPFEIQLTRGYVTVVDAVDADLALRRCFTSMNNNGNIYCGYKSNNRSIALHRTILSRVLGRELNRCECVDHIDGDGLNNRRSNLRLADKRQNAQNAKRPSNNTSGHKGVYWHKQRQKWAAYINAEGKMRYLGLFSVFKDACEAYRNAARRYFGEFARFD